MKVSSRVERQTRNLTRGLFWISLLLLGVTMVMTGKFGWDSGTSVENKALNAIGHGAVDIVGALLITGSAVCIAWRYFTAGVIVFVFACVCIGISGLGVFGFLSSNRIAVSKTAAKAEKVDSDQLEWLRNQTVVKGGSAAQRDTFLGEIKGQLRELKSGHVTAPDAQTEELAAAVGWTKEEMNRVLTGISAGSILFAQFACLWLYGFLRHRIEPDIETHNSSVASSSGTSGADPLGNNGRTRFKSVPFDEGRALRDLQDRLARGEHPIAKDLAQSWQRPKNTVSTWINGWEENGLLVRKQSGNRKLIRAVPAPHHNGNGRVMGSA